MHRMLRAAGVVGALSLLIPSAIHARPTAQAMTDLQKRTIWGINLQREARNLPDLTVNPTLMVEATRFSGMIAKLGNVSHRGDDGSDGGIRLHRAGYSWVFWGENLAAGQEGADALVAAWMGSPTHRAILLNPKPLEIGIGHSVVSEDPRNFIDYYAMEVGKRQNLAR